MTEKKSSQSEVDSPLKAVENIHRDLTDNIPAAIYQYVIHADGSDSLPYVSPGCMDIWELTQEQFTRTTQVLWEMVHKDDVEPLKQSFQSSADDMSAWECKWKITTPSGINKWLYGSGKPKLLDNGDVIWNAVIMDISEYHQQEIALDAFFEQQTAMNIIVNLEGKIVKINSLWSSVLGYRKEEMEGHYFIEFVHSDDIDKTNDEFARALASNLGTISFENRYKHKDGHYVLLLWSSAISLEEGLVYAVALDITEKREAEKKLEHLSRHDSLTGLPNRAYFTDRLQQTISQSRRHHHQFAVVFIDIDRFKNINDSMGHQAGDELLIEVSGRLKKRLRHEDLLCRLSGDEFIVLLEEIDGPEQVSRVAQDLMACFKEDFVIQGKSINSAVSLGISIYPQDASSVSELMASADVAMYQAKNLGRATYTFYSSQMTESAQRFIFIENALRNAIRNNELSLVFQPQYSADKAKLIGLEALLRWNHPTEGWISPTEFIPIAESCGLITDIGQWVLKTACQFGKNCLIKGLNLPRIAVNVAGQEFKSGGFINNVLKTLKDTGLPPQKLEIEVTESFVMDDPDAMISTLGELQNNGITIAIDDFGTGHSSLSYLKKLPIDVIKIDKTFMDDVCEDDESKAITDAIIALSKALKLEVIAEGVETQAQVDYLVHKEAYIQGYIFSRPLSPDDTLKEIAKY